MNIDLEKDIVQSLSSLYPLQEFEERAIDTVLNAIPHWIPVAERLPERDELVLVTYKTTDKIQIRLCMYFDDGSENPWWSYIDACCLWNNTILAWMSLPQPYREVTE